MTIQILRVKALLKIIVLLNMKKEPAFVMSVMSTLAPKIENAYQTMITFIITEYSVIFFVMELYCSFQVWFLSFSTQKRRNIW